MFADLPLLTDGNEKPTVAATFRRMVAYLLVAYLVIAGCKQIQKYSTDILPKFYFCKDEF
jgi:hypothetical protein